MKNVYIAFGYTFSGTAGYWLGQELCTPVRFDSTKLYCVTTSNVVSFSKQADDVFHVYTVQDASKNPIYLYFPIRNKQDKSIDVNIKVLDTKQINGDTLVSVAPFEGGGGLKFGLKWLDSSTNMIDAFRLKDDQMLKMSSTGDRTLPSELVFGVYLELTYTLHTTSYCTHMLDTHYGLICRKCSTELPIEVKGRYSIGWDGDKFWIGGPRKKCTGDNNRLNCLTGVDNLSVDILSYDKNTFVLNGDLGYTGCPEPHDDGECTTSALSKDTCICTGKDSEWSCMGGP
eukprot:CAMPEP_0203763882 /NCGR_PEP_ID=MMETSP0098-20131031/17019_1 /ASSEMBLY_ACC=CAM_ASM_000208 /TAXON_ID=96639 /ORGANISM=" , Strain NY0313808BC1" /LENGTH=285 /DNA_ID=CAMNT_0050659205 /DNA_START=680 /DNA_END=1537 /DNA_ORIENTATION=+